MNNDTTIGLDLGNKKHKVVGLDGRGKVILKCELRNSTGTVPVWRFFAGTYGFDIIPTGTAVRLVRKDLPVRYAENSLMKAVTCNCSPSFHGVRHH